MKCHHCLVDFDDEQTLWNVYVGKDDEGHWLLDRRICPTRKRSILHLVKRAPGQQSINVGNKNIRFINRTTAIMVLPRGVSRAPVPNEVPADIVEDYKEASLVLATARRSRSQSEMFAKPPTASGRC
jgi:hypothetical protein